MEYGNTAMTQKPQRLQSNEEMERSDHRNSKI